MQNPRRALLRITLATALVLAFGQAMAQATTYPNRPVKIVVPFTAGGLADNLARGLAQELSAAWAQPVVVENRPGANTIIAAQYTAKAPADGYTLLMANDPTLSSNQYLYTKLPYDPVADNSGFDRIAKHKKFYSKNLMMQIAKKGTVKNMKGVPKDIQKLFKTAHEIPYEQHVKMQAAWQKHIDNAVSKTINLPSSATPDDIKKAYLLAHKLKCKGITIYRYGSKKEQVLYLGGDVTSAGANFSGGHACGECNF